jgi:hypothetical protein
MHCLLSKLLVIICSKAGLCGLRNLESVAALQPNQQRSGLTARALLLLQFESEMPRGLKVSNCRPQARNSFLHHNASVCLHLGCVPTPLAAWNSKDSKHGQMGISRTPRWHHLPAVLSRMYGDSFMIWCEDMCLPSARGHRHTPAVLKRRPPNPKHSCRSATNRSLFHQYKKSASFCPSMPLQGFHARVEKRRRLHSS